MNMVGLFSNSDLSQSLLKSAGIYTNDVQHLGISLTCTGAPIGLFKLQCSDADVQQSPLIDEDTWIDVPNMYQSISDASLIKWSIAFIEARWLRIVWIGGGGTGAITRIELAYL